MSLFKVISIESSQDSLFIKEFVALRDKVRAPQYNVGGPGEEQTKGLIAWGLKHQANFWLVKDDKEKTILRLCARVTPNIKNHGTIGLFEIDLEYPNHTEAFKAGIKTVTNWLKEHGVKEVVAPIDMNTWFNYRFSIPGKHFFPRFSWEPTTPPEYTELFRKEGMNDLALFHTVFFPHFQIGSYCLGTGPMRKSFHNLTKKGFSLRPFDNKNFIEKEVPLFHEISHEAFNEAFLFEPIDLETFTHLYAGAVTKYDFTPSGVLLSPEGETAGFIFAFYDGDYLVIKSIALKKKFQGMNLSSGMIFNAVKQALALKKKGTISALVKTGIASESIEKNVKKTLWFSWAHYYLLLKKDLT
jgi:hypothetical protein